MKKSVRNFCVSVGLFLAFIIFTLVVLTVDRANVGAGGTEIGLAKLNVWAYKLLGTSEPFYYLSEVLGVISLLIAFFFCSLGAVQLIKRKSLKKIDKYIIGLGVFYLVVIAFYLLFELFIVNYRPVLVDGKLEASYPSSHTMLACCIIVSALLNLKHIISNVKIRTAIQVIGIVFIISSIVARMLSGVHWFTDIVGGALISTGLVALYVWGTEQLS